MLLLLLLFIPLVIPFALKVWLKWTYTWLELALHVLIVLIIVSSGYALSKYSDKRDVEILNGYVTKKKMERVRCSHSYRCNCYTTCTGSGSYRSCSTYCSTCYEHSFDQDWNVYTTVGSLKISRVDRRGMNEPPRWSSVQINEPASRTSWYTNYIKAAPDSLFNFTKAQEEIALPAYPRVFDYYRYNRVINNSVLPSSFVKRLNTLLNTELKSLGSAKQVNIIIVLVKENGEEYANALRSLWKGGKKNDVVVVAQVNEDEVVWANSFGWSKDDLVFVKIRDNLLALPSMTPESFQKAITRPIQSNYVRIPMEEFEYLKDEISPSLWLIVSLFIFGCTLSCGLGFFFHHNEVV